MDDTHHLQRRHSRKVKVGNIWVGGGAEISIQSMLNVSANDVAGNIAQAQRLEAAGCEILRTAVPRLENVKLVAALKEAVKIPIVADIHFDWRIALECVAAGADKIRLNPGNIGGQEKVRAVANACREKNVPIRIGVNAGSLEKDLLTKYGGPAPQAMADSALSHARLLEDCGFSNIILSLKASDVHATVQAYKIAASLCDYPLHLGITEAGTQRQGLIKSAAGIGALLLEGIGDTIRVSLTAEPEEEIRAAKDILRALGLRRDKPQIISCPSCGRSQIDLIGLTKRVETALTHCKKPITVAVMGCAVNGPGEARNADVGLAGGDGEYLLFAKGEILRKVSQEEALEALLEVVESIEDVV
ncbi:MAG: flavodoxin-dependent (E)-4-hydroxy-3-methylbut-2-enyl-diphosphate synthase [Oscillospiraceae bacterium]|nr:flavodoxin-dependent (E)-4-hydroxy-3-methylbut-2-enyl-diphosphate synthase [Oscillospiraceae bacterium]